MSPRFGFITVIVITLITFAAGFGVCLFNLDTIGACTELAGSLLTKFQQAISHIFSWAGAVLLGIKH